MITHYDLTQSEVDGKAFETDALYFCRDTGAIYLDSSADKTRIKIGSDVLLLATENDRKNILAPVTYKIYCVLESGCMYIYTTSGWQRMGGSQFIIDNVAVTAGSPTVITNNKITNFDTAEFIPDPSIDDLVAGSSCTCANGSVTVTVDSDYDVFGIIKVH